MFWLCDRGAMRNKVVQKLWSPGFKDAIVHRVCLTSKRQQALLLLLLLQLVRNKSFMKCSIECTGGGSITSSVPSFTRCLPTWRTLPALSMHFTLLCETVQRLTRGAVLVTSLRAGSQDYLSHLSHAAAGETLLHRTLKIDQLWPLSLSQPYCLRLRNNFWTFNCNKHLEMSGFMDYECLYLYAHTHIEEVLVNMALFFTTCFFNVHE